MLSVRVFDLKVIKPTLADLHSQNQQKVDTEQQLETRRNQGRRARAGSRSWGRPQALPERGSAAVTSGRQL